MNENLIIGVADEIIKSSKTYGEALQICMQVKHEIELRAYEQRITHKRSEHERNRKNFSLSRKGDS